MFNLIKIDRQSGIPLIGAIHFGVIDRGSTLLQVRTHTACNMNCTFCSTDAGAFTKYHPLNLEISDVDYLIDAIKEVIVLKNGQVDQIFFDSVGEPTAYPKLVELIQKMSKIPEIKVIAMQTNGTLLNKERIKALENAGLTRINMSVHTLNPEKGQNLFGSKLYNIERIKQNIQDILASKIDLILTPVYLPGVNEEELKELVKFSKEIGCKIAIQKYELYKYSRKDKRVKHQNWYKFFKVLEAWEKELGVKLKTGPADFKIKKSNKIPLVFKRGDEVIVEVKAPGWVKGEMLGAAKNRCVTVVDCNSEVGQKIKVKIIDSRDSIYLAKKC